MKTATLTLLSFAFLLVLSAAQAQTSPRTKYLNAGLGLGAFTAGGIPIGASLEVDVKENISVGGFFDYARYGYKYAGYRWNYNFLYFGARASYHLGDLLRDADISNPRWDPYAGLSLGLRTAHYSDNTGTDDFTSPYSSGAFLGLHLGSRYMFTEKVGAFAEVGYGVSALRLGVTARF
jgi:hypothetical protein